MDIPKKISYDTKTISDLLATAFRQSFYVAEIDWTPLAEQVRVQNYAKNEVIRAAGLTEKYLYYILSGTTGTFAYKKDKRICADLCFESSFCGDYASVLTQQPSNLSLEALEKTQLIHIPFGALLAFYQTLPSVLMNQIGRLSAEKLFLLKNQQLLDFQTLSAEERYHKLVANQPDIPQRVAAQHLASYLGITPESYSRLRKSLQNLS